MAAPKTELAEFIEQELKKYEGVMVPIKAGNVERMFTKKLPVSMLHPNPDDEFCSKTVGPNYSIYNRYVRTFQKYGEIDQSVTDDPITVEKIRPDGYMILNGHHRWAAAWRVGIKYLPVKIVNLTNQVDIDKMLSSSEHDKRVSMDLDEVVFCSEEDDIAEKPLPFPLNKVYKERIRLGIPSLLHYLETKGYDIWVYTSEYYSLDYIRRIFKHYSVKVDGIVTGTERKEKNHQDVKKKLEKKIKNKYKETIHIDRDMVLRTFRDDKSFEEYEIKETDPSEWSRKVTSVIHKARTDGVKS
jgi:hypothetical protein